LQSVINKYQNKFLEWFNKQWETEFQELNFETISFNDKQDLVRAVTNYKGNSNGIQNTIEMYVGEAYESSQYQTAALLGFTPENISFLSQASADYVFEVGYPLASDISNDLNKRALREIMNGIRAGEGYVQINDRVTQVFAKYNREAIPMTVQKTVHAAYQHVRMDMLEVTEMPGPSGEIEVIWVTAGDDRVRPEHVDLQVSSPIPISRARAHQDDFGCRCAVSPVSILRRIRRQGSVV